jgi:hypothetical protein
MIQHVGGKGFMMFWHAEPMGWIICWKQGIEKTMEIASAYKTDIAYLHGPIWIAWIWPPQGMSVRRVLDCKLFAEDVIVGHRDCDGHGKLSSLGMVIGEYVTAPTRVISPKTVPHIAPETETAWALHVLGVALQEQESSERISMYSYEINLKDVCET